MTVQVLVLLQAAAQAVQTSAHAVVVPPTDNPIAAGGLAIVVAMVLQALKNASWFPWLTRQTARLNFWASVVGAFLATAGIHFTYDVSTGGSISLPALHTLWQALVQWAVQQGAYKGLVVPAETLGDIRKLLTSLNIAATVDAANRPSKSGGA